MSEAAIAFAAAEADRSAEVLTAVSAWSPVTVPLGLRSYPDDYLGIMHRMAAETLAGSVGGLTRTWDWNWSLNGANRPSSSTVSRRTRASP